MGWKLLNIWKFADFPQPPTNINWSVVSGDKGVISWTPFPQPQCSTKRLLYSLTIVQLPTGFSPIVITTAQNNAGISFVQPNSTFLVIARTVVGSEQLRSTTASTLTFNTEGGSILYFSEFEMTLFCMCRWIFSVE